LSAFFCLVFAIVSRSPGFMTRLPAALTAAGKGFRRV
jgi:hypothetical protein